VYHVVAVQQLARDARSTKRIIGVITGRSVRPCLSVSDVDVTWAYRLD